MNLKLIILLSLAITVSAITKDFVDSLLKTIDFDLVKAEGAINRVVLGKVSCFHDNFAGSFKGYVNAIKQYKN